MFNLDEIQKSVNADNSRRKATEKQIAFAEKITELLEVAPTGNSFFEVSNFIGTYIDEYREKLATMPTENEMKKFVSALNRIYGNPLSVEGKAIYEEFKKSKDLVKSITDMDKKNLRDFKELVEKQGTAFCFDIINRECRKRFHDEDELKRLNANDYKRLHNAEMHELRAKLSYNYNIVYEEEELEAMNDEQIKELQALVDKA